MVRRSVIVVGCHRCIPIIGSIGTAIVQSFNPHNAIPSLVGLERNLLRELLADTFGASAPTAIASIAIRERVKYTSHLPPLTFPAAMSALAQPSPLRLGVGVI